MKVYGSWTRFSAIEAKRHWKNLNMKAKNIASDVENEVGRTDVETPPRKKLKQAQLPFQTLSPGVESSSSLLKNNKRKRSGSTDDIKIIKTVRPNDSSQLGKKKENVCSPAFSGECKKSCGTASKVLPNSHAEDKVMGHADNPAETSKICETVTDLDGNESGVKGEVLVNEVDRKLKSDDSKGKVPTIASKGSAIGDAGPDVIVLSDGEGSVGEENLIASSYKVVPTDEQNSFCKNETTDGKQAVSDVSPVADSEQSETENRPVVINECLCESVKSEKERSSSECDSDMCMQVSSKSSPQCSPEINSNDNMADIATPPKCSLQNSLSDDSFKEHTPHSETSLCSSLVPSQKIKKLTPKQLLKQLESARKKQEKERQRQEREEKKAEERKEREKKKAEEKEEKLRQKLEKEEQKKKEKEEKEEQKRKEKEEREELKKKEKEEKERKKQVELEIKNEEKRAKDEEKRKKEDKRQAEAAAFTSFFFPKKVEPKAVEEPKVKTEENFMPFQVKADMRLAPSTRTKLTAEQKQSLDRCIESQSQDKLYVDQLRSKEIIPQTSSSTWALNDFKDDDIVILEDDDISGVANIFESYPTASQLPRPKLLHFWENRRPPYWGTWRKKSQSIRPKNPFNMDETFFDYEVDSDDEWEEEEPGESLHGSDDEKESEDEYEVDNEFFVPHGYLSDEENVGDKDEDQSPEMLKIKLKLLELEFEEEMKQKTERLKPRLFGCVWVDSKTADSASGQLLKLLSPYRAVYQDGPIVTSAPDSFSAAGSPESKNQVPSPTTPLLKKKKKFPEAAIPALIKLIHGNVNRREFLAKEFLAYWNKEQQRSVEDGMEEGSVEGNVSTSQSYDIFKKSVTNKIKDLASWMACPGGGPMAGRMCWYVPPETRTLYGLADITLPNTLWNYTFKPKRRESDIHMTSATSTALTSESNPKQLITKFTKKMTEVERKMQFNMAPAEGATPDKRQGGSQHDDITQKNFSFNSSSRATPLLKTGEQHKRKVPILTSFPKSKELATPYKNSLMKFIKPQGNVTGEGKKTVSSLQNSDKIGAGEEECIVLSD